MIPQVALVLVVAMTAAFEASHGFDVVRARGIQHYPQNDLNRPVFYPQLGMSPEYHNLVYRYITDFAGSDEPSHVSIANVHHSLGELGETPTVRASDFILLRKSPEQANLNAIRMNSPVASPLTNPPLGGVMSNYVLARTRPELAPFPTDGQSQQHKRQVEEDDTVVINAESPSNLKMNEDEGIRGQGGSDAGAGDDDGGDGETDEGDEDQPAIAQSKPAAIALAGPGGVAQASPVGTALVGPGGLAVAAPSGTAVAGPAGQGVVGPTAEDKAKIVQKKIKEAWN